MRRALFYIGLVLALIAALFLQGCSTVRHRVQTVLVPCKSPPVTKPDMPADHLIGISDIFAQVKALLADRETRKGYEGQLEAAVKVCQ